MKTEKEIMEQALKEINRVQKRIYKNTKIHPERMGDVYHHLQRAHDLLRGTIYITQK